MEPGDRDKVLAQLGAAKGSQARGIRDLETFGGTVIVRTSESKGWMLTASGLLALVREKLVKLVAQRFNV